LKSDNVKALIKTNIHSSSIKAFFYVY